MKLKELLQELIDKDVSLEKSANILWEWKAWEVAKENERYKKSRHAEADELEFFHQLTERHRLQLEHYLVEANISQEMINKLIRTTRHEGIGINNT